GSCTISLGLHQAHLGGRSETHGVLTSPPSAIVFPSRTLHPLPHEVGDALPDHHGRDIGVGSNTVRHDGRIHHPQLVPAVHPAVLVKNGHRVRGRPHLTGAGDMLGSGDFA